MIFSLSVQAAPDRAARLHAFEAQLEANPSATVVLQGWCDTNAPGHRIVARQVQSVSVAPSKKVREALQVKRGEDVRYRRVQLICAGRVLSNADNWYLPDKLTAAMNAALENTETPFGVAVAALHFTRHNLKTQYLQGGGDDVLRHSAVLVSAKGAPFSFVVETYTRAISEK